MCTTLNKPIIDMAATAAKIKFLRKENGYSVRDIQNVFGFVNGQAVYNWENGSCIPTIDNLLILAALYGVSIEDIVMTKTITMEIETKIEKSA